jgi:hypothetical protein
MEHRSGVQDNEGTDVILLDGCMVLTRPVQHHKFHSTVPSRAIITTLAPSHISTGAEKRSSTNLTGAPGLFCTSSVQISANVWARIDASGARKLIFD